MAKKRKNQVLVPFDKIIEYCFYLLFFTVPLFFCILNGSSPFEFNKVLLVYIFAALIGGAWILKILTEKKVLLYRTPLDIPIALYLGVLLLSTIFSTYLPLSLWGKSTMPMGAFIPTLALILLYYAFVNHMREPDKILRSLYVLLSAGVIAAIYGVLQHYGVDFIRWGEQFLSRSFGTFGQANGLAAFVGALAPVTIWFYFTSKTSLRKVIFGGIFLLFVLCILFTASRSGLIGLGAALGITLAALLIYSVRSGKLKPYLLSLLVFSLLSAAGGLIFYFSMPSTPGKNVLVSALQQASIERGVGSRYLVWKGAIEIWKKHPLLGAGPETFGDQYNLVRLKEHNVASGWNMLFTKAHNEYLHFLATTGALGLGSYLLLILAFLGWAGYSAFRALSGTETPSVDRLLPVALAAGYVDILVSNLAGFSWTPIALLFFILPAAAISWGKSNSAGFTYNFTLSLVMQKMAGYGVLLMTALIFFAVSIVWYGDYLFTRAQNHLQAQNLVESERSLKQAIIFNPVDADYHARLARVDALIAQALKAKNQSQLAENYKTDAIKESQRAIALNPYREDLWREQAFTFIIMKDLDPSLAGNSIASMEKALALYPTGPINYYYLALILDSIGQKDRAQQAMNTSVQLKPDFLDARVSLVLLTYQVKGRDEGYRALEDLLAQKPDHGKVQSLLQSIGPADPKAAKRMSEYLAAQ